MLLKNRTYCPCLNTLAAQEFSAKVLSQRYLGDEVLQWHFVNTQVIGKHASYRRDAALPCYEGQVFFCYFFVYDKVKRQIYQKTENKIPNKYVLLSSFYHK